MKLYTIVFKKVEPPRVGLKLEVQLDAASSKAAIAQGKSIAKPGWSVSCSNPDKAASKPAKDSLAEHFADQVTAGGTKKKTTKKRKKTAANGKRSAASKKAVKTPKKAVSKKKATTKKKTGIPTPVQSKTKPGRAETNRMVKPGWTPGDTEPTGKMATKRRKK